MQKTYMNTKIVILILILLCSAFPVISQTPIENTNFPYESESAWESYLVLDVDTDSEGLLRQLFIEDLVLNSIVEFNANEISIMRNPKVRNYQFEMGNDKGLILYETENDIIMLKFLKIDDSTFFVQEISNNRLREEWFFYIYKKIN